MNRWHDKVVLVTGASTGIGKATARRLLEHGMTVVGCGRRLEALQELEVELGSIGELTVIACDVSDEEDVVSMFSKINKKYGGVDVCINNAGLSYQSPILSGESADWQRMFNVNVIGVLTVTREAVKSMKAKRSEESHIININSLSGHKVINNPAIHVYSATKFALTAITQGTRFELQAEQPSVNCRVSQISPGLVETSFVYKALGEQRASTMFQSFKALETNDIAETVIHILELPAHAQVQDIILTPYGHRL
ncbi:dehydrogenase/reductase SDR family member 11-like [Watersipora subatra]|uniref:dehydrogenase/reductase SDR family member 11-like n=1 Tax=Watersipora subatra TaxID=2589382 RepID=UPI00355B00FA